MLAVLIFALLMVVLVLELFLPPRLLQPITSLGASVRINAYLDRAVRFIFGQSTQSLPTEAGLVFFTVFVSGVLLVVLFALVLTSGMGLGRGDKNEGARAKMNSNLSSSFDDLLHVLNHDRRKHSVAVAQKVASASGVIPPWARPDLLTAAVLHDIGYGHEVSGFHPLDGARFLASQGFSSVVCNLVLNHSASKLEAELREIDMAIYDEFAVDVDLSQIAPVLWWADMTTGPSGQTVTVEERLEEICSRYGPDDLVTKFIGRARSVLLAAGQSPTGSM